MATTERKTTSPTSYHIHDQFYTSMFNDNNDEPSLQEEDSFLGVRMQFPQALVRRQSRTGPLPSSENKKQQQEHPRRPSRRVPQPLKTRNSLNDHTRRSTSTREKKTQKAKSHHQHEQRTPLTPEEMQMQQFYLEATRHQAATARVTNLEDFQKMTFTLPAAKTSSAMTPSPQKDLIASAFKQCPLFPTLTSSSSRTNQLRTKSGGSSMFRGKKTRTSSAAAGSFIAEASQADRYYYKSPIAMQSSRSLRNTNNKSHHLNFLDQIEEESCAAENKRRGWTSLLVPKKWTAHHRSLAVEI